MSEQSDAIPVAIEHPVAKTGFATVGAWFSVVRWNDGTTSIVDKPTLARMERQAAGLVYGLA